MTHADRVREFCKTQFIEPARARGDKTVSIRAGDIHHLLGFKKRLPIVCSALGANAFEDMARVQRIGLKGPISSANAVFTFRII